ncbi:MAG: IPTL-CTERM sorting domain-containing protein [Acidobacteria bacterium]|nr:IPTL-CTERM sorting domain-containing protein [Acidobacteriota bacterium]
MNHRTALSLRPSLTSLLLAAAVTLITAQPAGAIEATFELRSAPPPAELLPPIPGGDVYPVQLVIDDDLQEGAFGVAGAGGARQFLWFNRFSRPPGVDQFSLAEIWVLFPGGAGIQAGQAIELVVYRDPDGDPLTGAELLATVDETVQVADDLTFSVYTLATPIDVPAGGDVLIGVIDRWVTSGVTPPVNPAAVDLTASQGRSWFALWTGDPPEPPVFPPTSLLVRLDDFSPPAAGNFMIRGFGNGPPVIAIPTLGQWGLASLALLLIATALLLLRRRRATTALLAGILVSSFALPATAQVDIDTFQTNQAALSAPPTASSSQAGVMVGGTRDLRLEQTAGAGTDTAEVTGGGLVLAAAAGDTARLTVTWDADSDPSALGSIAPPIDLPGSGGLSSFRIRSAATGNPASLVMTVYSTPANASRAALLLPVGAAGDLYLSFSDFRTSAGTGADFSALTAFSIDVTAEDGTAVVIDEIVAEAPQIAASKTDALTVDVDMDSTADPGDRVTYTVTITNTGAEAVAINLADTIDANTTLVSGSVSSTPVPKPDQYRAVGNVTLHANGGLGRPGLLANDQDPDGGTLTVTSTVIATAQGGTATITDASTGTFDYDPPAGFRGVDTFSYDLEDDDGNMASARATVDVTGIVWFVDNTHGGPFEGTQANPFATMAAAEAASAPNDIIRVREGDGTATGQNAGFSLKPGQRIFGGAADLILDGDLIEAGAGVSVHGNTAGNGFNLADDSVIRGLRIDPSTGDGLAGNAVSNVLIENVVINPSGTAGGISLTGQTGGFTFASSAITAASSSSGTAVAISGGSGSFDFSGSTIAKAGGGLILVGGVMGGTFDFTGSAPTLSSGSSDGIALNNNTGSTFTFDTLGAITTGSGSGIRIDASGTVNLGTVAAVSATGGSALDIAGTTVVKTGGGTLTFPSLSSTNGTLGIRLNGVAPAVAVTGATTVSNAGAGIDLTSSGAFSFASLSVTTSAGAGLKTSSTGLVTVTNPASSIQATGGPGVDITGTALNMALATLTSTNSTGRGLSFSAASGTLNAAGGSVTGVPNGNRGVSINGGSLALTYGGTVTYTANDYAVRIQDTSSGSATFNAKVSAGASSLGIYVSNADSNATFADLDLGTSVSPMTHSAINLLNGSNGTFSFADTQVFTSGAAGVVANNGGNVAFTGTGNRITATNGRALTFENGTTISAAGATFERIDASGSDRGIRLASAGANGFSVTGLGTTTGSGGTLQNITARGIEVIGTNNVSFKNMALTDAATTNGADPTDANGACGGLTLGQNLGCNASVHLETVSGATLDNVQVLRSAQIGINGNNVTAFSLLNSTVTDAGDQANEFSLKFRDLLGTSVITNSTVRRTISTGTEVDQVRIQNVASTPLDLTVTNSHFDTNAADGPTSAFENTGFIATGHGSADMRLTFNGSFFQNNKGPGLTVGVNDTASNATVDYIVNGGTFTNNNVGLEAIAAGAASTVTFDINGAMVDDNPAAGINVDLNSSSGAGVTLQGHVRNNTVTHTGAGDCVQVNTRGAGHAIVAITGNTLNESGFERAIDVSTQEGSGDLDVVITGNTLNMTGPNPLRAMNVNSGADTGDSGTMCAKVGGSTGAEKNTVNSISGGDTRIRVRRRELTNVNLEGLPGPYPQTDMTTIVNYIASQNTGATGDATVGGGFGNATCSVPPMP